MFLIQKYTQYKAAQALEQKKKVTEKELAQLNNKIDKLLVKLDEHEPEIPNCEDDECVVCVNAKATMTTYPCSHRVICRKCFVKTIQMAVVTKNLPLRCVICRAKILRLKHGSSVPQSESLYSVTSNTSSVSGISSTSQTSSRSQSYRRAYSASRSSFPLFRKSRRGYELLRTRSPSPVTVPPQKTNATTEPPVLSKNIKLDNNGPKNINSRSDNSGSKTSKSENSKNQRGENTNGSLRVKIKNENSLHRVSPSCSQQLVSKRSLNRGVMLRRSSSSSGGLSRVSSSSSSKNKVPDASSSNINSISTHQIAFNSSLLNAKTRLKMEFQREFHTGQREQFVKITRSPSGGSMSQSANLAKRLPASASCSANLSSTTTTSSSH